MLIIVLHYITKINKLIWIPQVLKNQKLEEEEKVQVSDLNNTIHSTQQAKKE